MNQYHQMLHRLGHYLCLNIDKHNPRRLIRAIEIAQAIKKVPKLAERPRYNVLALGIKFPLNILDKRIETRLYKRIPGILKEIKQLRRSGLSWQRLISFGLEYDWFSKYLRGDISLDEATEKCFVEIKRFARKQARVFDKEKVIWVKNLLIANKLSREFLKE